MERPQINNSFPSFLEGRKMILAPLVGGSDLSFRLLARKYGNDSEKPNVFFQQFKIDFYSSILCILFSSRI